MCYITVQFIRTSIPILAKQTTLIAEKLSVGREVKNGWEIDTAFYWTYVDGMPFMQDGIVDTIELITPFLGGPLRIGIYRHTTGAACDFELMQEIEFTSLKVGYNKVRLPLFMQGYNKVRLPFL